jgi:uncharacterized protein (DUF4415 family)
MKSKPGAASSRRERQPIKQKISVCLNRDVLAWLKSANGNYQTRLNQLLREAMQTVLSHG